MLHDRTCLANNILKVRKYFNKLLSWGYLVICNCTCQNINIILFPRMIWWRTRPCPGTPTDGQSLSHPKTPKEDQYGSQNRDAAASMQMDFGTVIKKKHIYPWFREKDPKSILQARFQKHFFHTFPLNFQISSAQWRLLACASATLTHSPWLHSNQIWLEWSQGPPRGLLR